jgi:hypothetical protein
VEQSHLASGTYPASRGWLPCSRCPNQATLKGHPLRVVRPGDLPSEEPADHHQAGIQVPVLRRDIKRPRRDASGNTGLAISAAAVVGGQC